MPPEKGPGVTILTSGEKCCPGTELASERHVMALLKGKTALVTGGSTGIGLATAKRFVEEGAYVSINGRSQAELDAAVKETGENVTGLQGERSPQLTVAHFGGHDRRLHPVRRGGVVAAALCCRIPVHGPRVYRCQRFGRSGQEVVALERLRP